MCQCSPSLSNILTTEISWFLFILLLSLSKFLLIYLSYAVAHQFCLSWLPISLSLWLLSRIADVYCSLKIPDLTVHRMNATNCSLKCPFVWLSKLPISPARNSVSWSDSKIVCFIAHIFAEPLLIKIFQCKVHNNASTSVQKNVQSQCFRGIGATWGRCPGAINCYSIRSVWPGDTTIRTEVTQLLESSLIW